MSASKPPDPSRPPVRVVRSPRRRKTVTAYRQGETVVVLLPARMSRREEDHWVTTMLERLEKRARRRRAGTAGPHAGPPLPAGDGRAALGPLGREHAGPLRLLHARRRHHPAVGPPRPLAAVGPRLRARPRAGPPGRARPLAGVLAPGRPLPAVRAGPRVPDRQGHGGGRGLGLGRV